MPRRERRTSLPEGPCPILLLPPLAVLSASSEFPLFFFFLRPRKAAPLHAEPGTERAEDSLTLGKLWEALYYIDA